MRYRRLVSALGVAGGLMASSCSLGDSAETENVNVYIGIDNPTLGLGEIMTVTVTAKNVGYEPWTLTGPSDCLLYIEVLATDGSIVWHSNGGCVGQSVTQELAPGEEESLSIQWNGTNLAGARLASGFYSVRGVARLTGRSYLGPPTSVALE